MPLHVNIEDLLNARSVESERLEFKAGWNPDAIYRSICAFANDFENVGGGYILIGVEEESGIAKRPVVGLSASKIASIQKEMIGYNNLINPVYHPKLFIETVDGQQILVIWVPGGICITLYCAYSIFYNGLFSYSPKHLPLLNAD
jgi:ATP-dependent DNA helicase RecG